MDVIFKYSFLLHNQSIHYKGDKRWLWLKTCIQQVNNISSRTFANNTIMNSLFATYEKGN